jgi:hypothetical protein
MVTKPKKKVNLAVLGGIAGSIIAISSLTTIAQDRINAYIDNRIDCKMQYAIELLKQITTPEQQSAAEDAVRRWNGKK